jgi:L-threonylcarbamoyladenylate synthase
MENKKDFIKILKSGGVGVMPTDTLYGLVGRANSKKAVERIYKIKGRDRKKPFIILISSLNDLKKFGIEHYDIINNVIMKKKLWPGPVSVVLPCTSTWIQKMKYLHRDVGSLAFRFPKKKSLLKILKQTGPLVAPSANPESLKPAANITQAKKYFGPIRGREGSQRASTSNGIDFYLSGGTLKGKPSALIKIDKKSKIEVLRGKIK